MGKTAPNREKILFARVRPREMDLVVLAASKRGITISELVREAVLTSAARIVQPEGFVR